MGGLGETAQKVASRLARIDTNPSILHALAGNSPELEIGRESFMKLWRRYQFLVKTFREALAVSGFNAGALNEKVSTWCRGSPGPMSLTNLQYRLFLTCPQLWTTH